MTSPEPHLPVVLFRQVSVDGGLTIRDMARDLHVSPSTIRAWEERYQVPMPSRTPGGHRRYDLAERRQLVLMRDEIERGRRPADAAALVKALSAIEPGPRISLRRFVLAARARDAMALQRELDNAKRGIGVERAISWFAVNALRELSVATRLGLCQPDDMRRALVVIRAWMAHSASGSRATHHPRLLVLLGSPGRRGIAGDGMATIMKLRGWDVVQAERPVTVDRAVGLADSHASNAVLVVAEEAADRRAAIALLAALWTLGIRPLLYAGTAFASTGARRRVRGQYVGEDLIGAADVLVGILETIEASPSTSTRRASGNGALGGFAS